MKNIKLLQQIKTALDHYDQEGEGMDINEKHKVVVFEVELEEAGITLTCEERYEETGGRGGDCDPLDFKVFDENHNEITDKEIVDLMEKFIINNAY